MTTAAERKFQQKNKLLIRSFVEEIFNEHDLSSVEKYFGEGSIEGSPQSGKGGHGFKQFLIHFFGAFPDWHTTIEQLVAEDNLVMVFLKGSGTHKGKFQGLPPTNKLVNIRSADLYRIDNERITGHWDIVDQSSFLKQTGVLLSETTQRELKDARVVWIHDY